MFKVGFLLQQYIHHLQGRVKGSLVLQGRVKGSLVLQGRVKGLLVLQE